jgi:hypothetical protein
MGSLGGGEREKRSAQGEKLKGPPIEGKPEVGEIYEEGGSGVRRSMGEVRVGGKRVTFLYDIIF